MSKRELTHGSSVMASAIAFGVSVESLKSVMHLSRRRWYWQLLASSIMVSEVMPLLATCLLGLAFSGSPTKAQIVSDTTLGAESSVITPQAPDSSVGVIQGGATRGANLFHSFEQFSVPTGGTAYFNNALNIQNIFSRVTGGSISNIDGLIRANGTANLFLLNPNGIIFGPNASLNIGGSFVGSTASSLNFADGTQFSATARPTTPLLTVNVPIGLQYEANPGRILVQGNGQGTRTTTDLIDTTFGLRVQPNQTLALVSGNVSLEGGTLKTAGGRIELGSVAGPSLVSLTPIDKGWALTYEGVPTFGDIQLFQQATVDASGAGSGDIQVRGRRISLTSGSQIEASTLGSEPGGTLAVTASESVEVIGSSADGQLVTGLGVQVYPGPTGAGGNLTIETGRLIVRDGAQISTGTLGEGSSGNLEVRASESVELVGESSGLFTSVQSGATGAGGNLTIETGRLIVRDGAQVFAGTLGEGSSGNLEVRASESVELVGRSANSPYASGLFTDSGAFIQSGATGAGGNLTIETGRLIVRDGAEVNVSSLRSGNAGNLEVAARSIRLDNKALLSANTTGGQGNILLRSGDLVLRRGSNITTNATGTATGGNITIDTGVIAALENSDISANAEEAFGGQVRINAQGIFGTEFRNQPTSESDITASSNLGSQFSGSVEINTSNVDLNQGLITLPVELVNVEGLIANSCIARSGEQRGNFNITGAGGLPTRPGDAAISPYPTGTVRSIPDSGGAQSSSQTSPVPSTNEARKWKMGDPIVEPQGVYRLANGELVLSRECSH